MRRARQDDNLTCHPGSKVHIKLLAGPVCVALSVVVYFAAGHSRHTNGVIIAPVNCWHCRITKIANLGFKKLPSLTN